MDGVVGLGESASPADAAAVSDEFGQGLVGRDTGEVLAELGRASVGPAEHRRDGKVLVHNARAGIEIALWDVRAREAGVPLHELLGGAGRSKIPFTEYFAYRAGREESPAAVAAYCAQMVEEHDSPVFEGKVAVRPVAGTRRFAAACEKVGVGFWFYSGDFGIATAAYLHLAAATPYSTVRTSRCCAGLWTT